MGKPKPPKVSGSGKITPPASVGNDPNTRRVVFGFRYITKGYDLKKCDAKHGGNLIDALRMRCSITWAELRSSDHRGLGAEKISAAIRVGIPQQVPENKKSELLSLRFGPDKERFIGFQDGATLEIVWIDHSGECYKH